MKTGGAPEEEGRRPYSGGGVVCCGVCRTYSSSTSDVLVQKPPLPAAPD